MIQEYINQNKGMLRMKDKIVAVVTYDSASQKKGIKSLQKNAGPNGLELELFCHSYELSSPLYLIQNNYLETLIVLYDSTTAAGFTYPRQLITAATTVHGLVKTKENTLREDTRSVSLPINNKHGQRISYILLDTGTGDNHAHESAEFARKHHMLKCKVNFADQQSMESLRRTLIQFVLLNKIAQELEKKEGKPSFFKDEEVRALKSIIKVIPNEPKKVEALFSQVLDSLAKINQPLFKTWLNELSSFGAIEGISFNEVVSKIN